VCHVVRWHSGLYAGKQRVVGVAEGAHALARELGGEGGRWIPACSAARRVSRLCACVDVEGTAYIAAVGEGAQG
jgi:hypothetical protein